MFDILTNLLPGRRSSSVSIPILDGALKPNNLLEVAPVLAADPGFEDIALHPGGDLYAARGQDVCQVLEDGSFRTIATFDRAVTALAFTADGRLAVSTGNAVVIDADRQDRRAVTSADGKPFVAVNSLSVTPGGDLLVTDGSSNRSYPEWKHDLMEKGHSGRLVQISLSSTNTRTLASGLRYAFGCCVDAQQQVLVSESWKHQVSVARDGKALPAIPSLPGYPARMSVAPDGGLWLVLFASRTQLVEFVLRENDYRREMMQTIDPRYWIGPALSSGEDFLEPLQGGSVKQMGILKPWAPPRSYGLVIKFDADFVPRFSIHSRVGGRNHGVVAVAQRGDDLFVLSKGAGRILRLSVSQAEAQGMQGMSQ